MKRVLLLGALCLMGCQSDPVAPARQFNIQAGHAVAKVSGSAQFTNDLGLYRRMEIVAAKDDQGAVTGTMQFVAGALIIKGTITCLTVHDNVAWIGGVVESAKFTATPVGSEFYMAVVDNGQGQGTADQTTTDPFRKPAGSAQAFCAAAAPPTGLRSMVNGNLQVEGQ